MISCSCGTITLSGISRYSSNFAFLPSKCRGSPPTSAPPLMVRSPTSTCAEESEAAKTDNTKVQIAQQQLLLRFIWELLTVERIFPPDGSNHEFGYGSWCSSD